MTRAVEIIEVAPRDGLQNEPVTVSTEVKLELIRRAISAGIRRIEVASFVHPRLVPQMADAEAICAGLEDNPEVVHVGLVLNRRGLRRAIDTGHIDEIGCVAVATDGFGLKNQNQTAEQSVEVCESLIAQALEAGMRAQATISMAFGCPFEGRVDPQFVVDMACRLADCGPREISLADTIGVAVPGQVEELFGRLREALGDAVPLRAHFHNTRNTGIANAYAALESGVAMLDASIGGIGGCPFAPRATGNIPTEDLLYMLDGMDYETGVDLDQVINAAGWLGSELHRPVPGMLSRAGAFP